MAYTRLSDVYNPVSFNPTLFQAALRSQKVLNSPAVVNSAQMNADMTGNGFLFSAPVYNHIADSNTAAWVPDDDITHIAVPEKLSYFSTNYLRLARNKGWAAADVVTDLTGLDPMQVYASQAGAAMAKVREVSLMNVLKGTMNLTTATSALFKVIASESTGGVGAATKLNISAIIDLLYTVQGDNFNPAGMTLIVHPLVAAQLAKDDFTDPVPQSRESMEVTAFGGIRVITSGAVPTRAGTTSGTVYTSYLLGAGAIQYGVGRAKNPTSIARTEDTGYSGAHETLWVRDVFGYAPKGFSYTGATNPASPTITDANLATPANWTKVLDNSLIPMMAIESNV